MSHLRELEVEEPVTCSSCGKTFLSSSHLQMHVVRHHEGGELTRGTDTLGCGKDFYCPVEECERSKGKDRPFPRLGQLKQHYHTMHGRKDLKCERCGRQFGLRHVWKRHQGECGQNFQCRTCGDNFRSRNALYQHSRRKKHEMPEGCKSRARKAGGTEVPPTPIILASITINPVIQVVGTSTQTPPDGMGTQTPPEGTATPDGVGTQTTLPWGVASQTIPECVLTSGMGTQTLPQTVVMATQTTLPDSALTSGIGTQTIPWGVATQTLPESVPTGGMGTQTVTETSGIGTQTTLLAPWETHVAIQTEDSDPTTPWGSGGVAVGTQTQQSSSPLAVELGTQTELDMQDFCSKLLPLECLGSMQQSALTDMDCAVERFLSSAQDERH